MSVGAAVQFHCACVYCRSCSSLLCVSPPYLSDYQVRSESCHLKTLLVQVVTPRGVSVFLLSCGLRGWAERKLFFIMFSCYYCVRVLSFQQRADFHV
jgi:hypothetical protein